MFRRPWFWGMFVAAALAGSAFTLLNFSRAFSLVELDLDMDRTAALAEARRLAGELRWGPEGFEQAASFRVDDRARSFVELEAGGADAFASLLREGPFYPYQWTVRHFQEGEVREVVVRFRPDGAPYGFRERLAEDAAGAALDAEQARAIAESQVAEPWGVRLESYELVESSQQERPSGRVDHTFVYERPDVAAGEGRFRLRLVVSGDRFTELTHFLQIPEAFDRRYEEMRSANEGITIAASFAMLVLYGIGGIGVGLFVLLRRRWVLWRQPLVWGSVVAFLQLLAGLNQWPLVWLQYDTALSAASFVLQQATALVASFFAFTIVFTLSFMTAESLTRRAFPNQIQLWRVWSREGARSVQILGRTVGGYLFIAIDLAFLVAFYWITTRYLGWWSPSDLLLNPDSLATLLPWLDPIALSLQAGFWEECLFRAVPLAGAALLGNRFGGRRYWITAAFVIQILVFAAGHAAYPTQPAYARVVELIVPSTVFGLVYLRFGLVPSIVMHFGFDAVLFGIPLFVSTAPGAWLDRAIFLLLLLVPLWVVLAARLRGGAWIEASDALRNRSWQPAAPKAARDDAPASPRPRLSLPPRPVLLGVGAVGLALVLVAQAPSESPPLAASRVRAQSAARQELAGLGVDVGTWHELQTVVSGRDEAHRFVWSELGPERLRELLGTYLSGPRWRLRYVHFEGDVAARAEEHVVWVDAEGAVKRREHRLAEGAAGAALDEEQARALVEPVLEQVAPRSSRRETSAESAKLPARTDWTFVYRDESVADLGGAEARIEAHVSGDEVTDANRYLHLPETWRRQESQRRAIMSVVAVAGRTLLGLLIVAGSAFAVLRWTRGRFDVRAFFVFGGLGLAVSLLTFGNSWPVLVSDLSTAQPLSLQVGIVVVGGLIGQAAIAALLGLMAGHGHSMVGGGAVARPATAAWAGPALGLGYLGVTTTVAVLVPQAVPPWSSYDGAATLLPWLDAALGPIAGYLLLTLIALLVFTSVSGLTQDWSRRRPLAFILLLLVGLLVAPGTSLQDLTSWLVSGIANGVALLALYVWVFRGHPTLLVLATAGATLPRTLSTGFAPAFDGALPGSLLAAAGIGTLAWLWYRHLAAAAASDDVGPEAID